MKNKNWLKRVLAGLAAMTLLVGCLVGCGNGSGGESVALEDPDKCPSDSYEINWYLMAEPQEDILSVETALNEYLKDKINATVKINCLPSAQYAQKMNTMINAGQYFDLCFVARWMLEYINNARDGAFYALDDQMETYMKETIASYEDSNTTEMLELSKVDGKLYALPVNKEMATQYGWVYRKDIADKYGIDMTQYKTFEALEPVLKQIKENEPEMNYPLDWKEDSVPWTLYVKEGYVFKDGTYPEEQQLNVYETPEYKQACLTARDFYNKGYVRPDVLTATDYLQRMKDGKTFAMIMPVKPGKAKELFKESNFEFAQAEVTEPYIDYLAGTGSMQAISATSKNPVRVMRFLNLLNTDPYVKNLILHGIEGKHYTKVDEKTVAPIENSGYDFYENSWTIGNVFIDYLLDTEEPDKLESLKAFNGQAKNAKINGFLEPRNPDLEVIKSNVGNAVKNHNNQLVMGVVDTETELKAFLDELKACEVDTLLAGKQTMYDEYLKTLN